MSKDNSASTDLVIDIPSLFRNAGSFEPVECQWSPSEIVTSYSSAKALVGVLNVEALTEKITVSGSIDIHWIGPCRRCLEEAKGITQIFIQEIFEHNAAEGETFEFPSGEKLDLKPMLTEQTLLSLPLAPLCSDTCEGPIDTEFPIDISQNQTSDSKQINKKDPRWEALDVLKFDDDDQDHSA
ncbi:MAG: YceD family protein [Actinomycetota bacterium]|nr:YceD family protein [Actinomycetota bacterium]